MIPIRLRLINEYFFCTKNIIDVRKLTAYDFLSEACLKCYGLKEETLSLFVDKTKSIENNNVSIKKLPDNLLQSVVINFAMGAGLREIIKKTYNDSQFSGLTISQMESWMITTRPRRREPLWAVTDETMRNWLKQAVRRAEADGVHFSIPVTPHTFRHSYIMHMLYHRQPRKVIQALAGHRDPRSMEVYTRVFALDMAATLAVPFTGEGRDAAEILRTLPPLK